MVELLGVVILASIGATVLLGTAMIAHYAAMWVLITISVLAMYVITKLMRDLEYSLAVFIILWLILIWVIAIYARYPVEVSSIDDLFLRTVTR